MIKTRLAALVFYSVVTGFMCGLGFALNRLGIHEYVAIPVFILAVLWGVVGISYELVTINKIFKELK